MKTPIRGLIACCLLLLWTSGVSAGSSSPFQVIGDDGPLSLRGGDAFARRVTIRVPEGHYLYAAETDVDFLSLEGLLITDIRYPKSSRYVDPYLGKEVDIFRGDVVIEIRGRVPGGLDAGEHDLIARVSFRGCSPTVCFRPAEAEVAFRIDVVPTAEAVKPTPPSLEAVPLPAPEGAPPEVPAGGIRGLLEVQDFAVLMERGLFWTILIVFIAGILTSLTPCVWPVIPVVLLFVGVHPHKRLWENFLLAATLVAGLVLVYAILGIAAVGLGKNLGFLYQQRWFLVLIVLFFLAMSLAMFGVFDLRLPRRWQHKLHKLGGQGYRGAFLAGMGTGLVASPCAGPVLAAVLGHVALQRNYVAGFALLVVYGIGMGLLFVVLGACYGELAGKLKSGPWMLWVRRLLGVLLLFPAAFYMGSLFRWSGDGIFWGGPASRIAWTASEPEALREAAEAEKAVMIEFGAKWCPPCQALDRNFFSRPEIEELSGRLVALRVDATVETPEVRAMIEKHKVVGWPTVLFLDPMGRPYRDLRVGNYNPAAIERAMREAVRRTGKADEGSP